MYHNIWIYVKENLYQIEITLIINIFIFFYYNLFKMFILKNKIIKT